MHDHRPSPVDELIEFQIGKMPGQCTKIGKHIEVDLRGRIMSILTENADLFAWSSADMPRIDPNFICHKLAIYKEAKPVSQKKRKIGGERREVVKVETQKLLSAGFIREIKYTTWLANVAMVKKSNGKWRMCVDYIDLNKACPKDAYTLPNIDRLVDGASGYAMLSFLDVYSGYNQIPDEEYTAFITEQANYCYHVMPFGLKNAGATYQRLMDKVFAEQIGRNLEVYVDDMVIKTKSANDHVRDLEEIFQQVRRYNMRLNPEKCVFGVQGGKFLGFMITCRGIEANPDKCQTLINMRSPQNHKEVQRLAGRLASLSRFIPKMAEKAKPIFNLLKKPKNFVWDDRCEQAFSDFKIFLSAPPILTKPQSHADLLLYLAMADNAISAALMQNDGKKQIPIYFISRVLKDTEKRYQTIEKLVLALVTSARRLRPYFQSHQIVVKTDYPIKQILRKPDLAGRMTAWSIELSEYGIKYESRGALKAQCLADFIVELTPSIPTEEQSWILHIDGSSNTKGSGAGIILEGPNEMMLELAIKFDFKATNNQAEYEALLAGLRLARDIGVKKLRCCSDSKLITEQVGGSYQTKEPQLQKYNLLVSHLSSSFDNFQMEHIPRAQNVRANLLSKLASTKRPGQHKTIIQETISALSYNFVVVSTNYLGQPSWMSNIWQYLTSGTLLEDKAEASKIKLKSCHFTIEAGELFKRGFSVPLLKCLNSDQAGYVMDEIHRGICGMHSGTRSMAARVIRVGYYWPTMRLDCKTYVQKCEACQKFGNLHQLPATALHSMQSTWPFAW
uniref:Retrovirus-related Pol polyprotein from transposon 297 family n=1 Tax=Cajanus cajan TaxID=3821 RepID=A0A151TS13_CAJCA|nr:Retrovirus-related Pol polyprotein from transposon 297 family [Cajanus cajan]